MISKVRKRNGKLVSYRQIKITNAIKKAFIATKTADKGRIAFLSKQVKKILNKKFKREIPSVEDIQDTVEEVLLNNNFLNVLRAYVIYRERHRLMRLETGYKEIRLEPILSLNAIKVLQKRYLLRNENENIIETPRQLFYRVARAIASIDKKYGGNVKKTEKEFYNAMKNLEFIPNSPVLFNAGTKNKLALSACFVLPIEDSLESIFDAVKNMALIEQAGGGVGFSFSRLRPKGDIVRSTTGVASGPLSFMNIFDMTTDVIKQGGKRRGAMMGILRVDHPDILEFISVKQNQKLLTNFNISVAITDSFMDAVFKNKDYELINSRTKKVVRKLNARKVFDLIVKNAWLTGDPGLIFIDRINKSITNSVPSLGPIEATNPCGEEPLYPFESCVLGSINLIKIVEKKKVNWEKLSRLVKLGVHFLDNVIDAQETQIEKINEMTKNNRRIGLGIMGWAEAVIRLGIRYDSNEAIKLANKLMKFIQDESRKMSVELARKRGNFPNFKKSIWKRKYKSFRNAALTTIAPTGTISIISGCSSGIEPIFSVSFVREVLEGARLLEINPEFERIAKERKFYSRELMEKIAKVGSVQKIKGIPRDIKKLFVTALDIKPEWHIKHQAAFQKYTDNAVSKTINLPKNASVEDIRKVYLLAYKLKCKGITIYRYGSKPKQVLYIEPYVKAHSEYAGGHICAECMF
ncbi:MAG: adenosylcobalamin-dependent ribonucleoside-diphosphate reductase [Nanoarchaeota archaeon]